MNIPDTGSFSGADIVAGVYVPALKKFTVFGELATISYSIHREFYPVRTLGSINARGYCRGARSIAGSLIFTVFDRHVLYEIQKDLKRKYQEMLAMYTQHGKEYAYSARFNNLKFVADEMPPFDVIIHMTDESSAVGSKMAIRGVRVTNEGQTMSINDMITENVMQYLAVDIDLMEPLFANENY